MNQSLKKENHLWITKIQIKPESRLFVKSLSAARSTVFSNKQEITHLWPAQELCQIELEHWNKTDQYSWKNMPFQI